MNTLQEWTGQVCAELGIAEQDLDTATVLDLARDVAHAVARPAAPLSAYLLGAAVGRGRPLAETAARLSELARGWASHDGEA